MKWRRISKRKAINTGTDPYFSSVEFQDLSRCRGCGAVYHEKRWVIAKDAPPEPAGKIVKANVLCPSCRKKKEKYAEGFLTLRGDFLKEHREEVLRLIRNKEEREAEINPLGRIIEIRDMEDTMEITTTTEKLAQRIGRMLNKAFSGAVEYKWSGDAKIARVVWTR